MTVPPTEDPRASVEAELSARPPPEGSGGLVYEIVDEVQDGVYFRVWGRTAVGEVDFWNWHLGKGVYESAAREAGLGLGEGGLRWGVTSVPERYFGGVGEERCRGVLAGRSWRVIERCRIMGCWLWKSSCKNNE